MNSRRAGLLAVACCCALWLAAAAPAAETRPIGPARPLRPAQRLAVNTDGGPALAVQASQADGEAQLLALAATSQLEEGWAFIPAEKLWIEIGGATGRTGRRTYHVLDDTVYLLMQKYDALVIYHIHPQGQFAGEVDGPFQQLQWTVGEALPSYADMAVMIDLTGFFAQRWPQGRLEWRIVSRHGVTGYGLSPQAAREGGVVQLKRFSYRPLDQDDDAELLEQSKALLSPSAPGPAVDQVIERCVARLNSGQVFVWYRPLGR